MKILLSAVLSITLLSAFTAQPARAGSATWSAVHDGSLTDWTDVTNWTPATVPNGSSDIATFPENADTLTLPTVTSPIELNGMVFEPGCPSFFTLEIDGLLTISGSGIIDNSGSAKVIFVKPYPAGEMHFTNSAVATGSTTQIAAVLGRAIRFYDTSSAGTGFVSAEPGTMGSLIELNDNSDASAGNIYLFSDLHDPSPAMLSIYKHKAPGVTVGSLSGGGLVLLGAADGPATARTLSVGAANSNTSYYGVIEDGGKRGRLNKVGTGRLTLSGANLYNGGTRVAAGQLIVSNKTGSGTGTGRVQVLNQGLLGGIGVIAGDAIIGSGQGSGAQLAPSSGGAKPSALTLQGSLKFHQGSAYLAKIYHASMTADEVIANSIVIESGATFTPISADSGTLPVGTVLTVISNTSAVGIAGNFSNLPDGAIVAIGPNNFQANYEGGDGNDLTLTAVP